MNMKTIPLRTKEIFTEWTESIWPGNPELKLSACIKTFKNPLNGRKTPVWIWGKNEFHFTVASGAHSEFSYTGYCVDCDNILKAREYVDALFNNKKLFK